jgi:hypothetical protein
MNFVKYGFRAVVFQYNLTDHSVNNRFPEIERSVSYFWSISEYQAHQNAAQYLTLHLPTAGPVVGIFFVLFCYEWIWNAMKTAGRVLARRRREEMVMTMYESKKRQQRR